MRARQSLRLVHAALRPRSRQNIARSSITLVPVCRKFHASSVAQKIQTHFLSDIGEGVKEVQIIQWFVEEGANVEEWAPLCEVQSDKASVEITSKYNGVIKKLLFEQDAIVQVGDGMLDIEVEDDDVEGTASEEPAGVGEQGQPVGAKQNVEQNVEDDTHMKPPAETADIESVPEDNPTATKIEASNQSSNLATPAVRALLREHKLEIAKVEGTGRDGRVLKEDVQEYLEVQNTKPASEPVAASTKPDINSKQTETLQNLTPVQAAMFKTMTKSLSIPHFLYSDSIDITSLVSMRANLNASRTSDAPKLSYLPFIIKAISLALNKYPILNARLDNTDSKPKLVLRSNHNIGVAMDTPAGLLVPVIKSVNARSITSIANELARLSELGQAGRLSSADLSGGTMTVSNIGSIGGEVVGPVIVEGQLAIMGVGKIKPTPVFAADGRTVERADLVGTSWSADHRVVDGATMARMAQVVQEYLAHPEKMIVDMT